MALSKVFKKLIPLYTYHLEWDDEEKIFIVRVDELPECITQGRNHRQAMAMAYKAIEGYLETLEDNDQDIPMPLALEKHSGEFVVRGDPKLHRRLLKEASRAGMSLNKYVISKLEEKN